MIDPQHPGEPNSDTGMIIDDKKIVWYEMACNPTAPFKENRENIMISMQCRGEGEEWRSDMTFRAKTIQNIHYLLVSEREIETGQTSITAYKMCQ
jgi:hypothetical protein